MELRFGIVLRNFIIRSRNGRTTHLPSMKWMVIETSRKMHSIFSVHYVQVLDVGINVGNPHAQTMPISGLSLWVSVFLIFFLENWLSGFCPIQRGPNRPNPNITIEKNMLKKFSIVSSLPLLSHIHKLGYLDGEKLCVSS